jgi:hypothetical protein
MDTLKAGAASIDISPTDSQFLFGYPHVERFSTGIHDPLLSTALYLFDGRTEVMFIANDIIFVTKALTQRVRRRIQELTGMPASHIMITATHTHSGPKTVDYASNAHDMAVPPVDPSYLLFFEDRMVDAAIEAQRSARPARVGLTVADGTGVGTNRRDPSGPSDPEVPVLLVETASGDETIACMMVYSMHPTVLHQDSKLVSGDFPAMARQYVQKHVLGPSCPVLYHTGPAGNQSLRHVTRSNTFEEAERLGHMLGRAIAQVIPDVTYTPSVSLSCQQDFIDLPRRTFPTVEEAEQKLERAVAELEHLRQTGAPRQIVRTAEVDWFGAEETVTLARAARDGRLDAYYQASLPAEIQVIGVGHWAFVGWPGEIFVEHALTIKAHAPNTFVISLANGELQGYIVTEASAREGGYEASNSLFGTQSGPLLINKTLELLNA